MLKVENIKKDEKILAVILRNSSPGKKVEFLTPSEFPLQLGVHKRKKNEFVEAHEHMPFKELKNLQVQEAIFVKKGRVSVDIYNKKELVKNVILHSNDIILLNSGHSLKFLEDTELIEVKQGPYRGKEYEKSYVKNEK